MADDEKLFRAALAQLCADYDYLPPLAIAQALASVANDLRFHNGLDEPDSVSS